MEVLQISTLLEQIPDEGLNLDDLSSLAMEICRENLRERLITLWQQGKIFVSRVERQGGKYFPTDDALWTLYRKEGYFGYSPISGVYQITPSSQQLRLQLLVTFYLGAPISSITVSPSRDEFAVGLYSGELIFGSLKSASIINKVAAHTKRIWSIDYSQDGKMLVSGSQDGRIIVWDHYGDKLEVIAELEDWITCVRFSPDGTLIVSGHKIIDPVSPAVRVWTINPPKLMQTYTHHEEGKNVYAVEVLPDGSGFVSGGSDKKIAYCRFDQINPVFQSEKHAGTVTSLAVHPELEWIASGAWTGTIKVWDCKTGTVLRTIEAHNTRVTSLACSPSGKLLASASRDSSISIWLMPNGRLLSNHRAHEGWVRAVRFCKEDLLIISGGSEGCCKVWSLESMYGV